jgi:hypothetical protein
MSMPPVFPLVADAIKAGVGKEFTRAFEVIASALALLTAGGYFTQPSTPTRAADDIGFFLGVDITADTTKIHSWFTDSTRSGFLTCVLAGIALLAYGTSVVATARIGREVRWAYQNIDDKDDARFEAKQVRLYALGRVARCATTWIVCLCLLAEIHTVHRYGNTPWLVGITALVLLAVTAVAEAFERSEGEGVGSVAAATLFNVTLNVMSTWHRIVMIPSRLHGFLTIGPWDSGDAQGTVIP